MATFYLVNFPDEDIQRISLEVKLGAWKKCESQWLDIYIYICILYIYIYKQFVYIYIYYFFDLYILYVHELYAQAGWMVMYVMFKSVKQVGVDKGNPPNNGWTLQAFWGLRDDAGTVICSPYVFSLGNLEVIFVDARRDTHKVIHSGKLHFFFGRYGFLNDDMCMYICIISWLYMWLIMIYQQ